VCTYVHGVLMEAFFDWLAVESHSFVFVKNRSYSMQRVIVNSWLCLLKKGSPYSITEYRVLELILVFGSQCAGDVSRKPSVGCHCFPPGLQLPLQPVRGLLPVSLLGEQRHDGCEWFAWGCYPTASKLRFEPRPFCTWVQHANHLATEPACVS